MTSRENADIGSWIASAIRDFIETSPENTLQNKANDRAFDTPLVGFSSGDDPIYIQYKDCVENYHWTPLEIFSLTFPEGREKAEDLTVISWVLPQTEPTKSDNRKETMFPSERWARARIFGEIVNEKLRSHVVRALEGAGHQAVAPALSPNGRGKNPGGSSLLPHGRSAMRLMLQDSGHSAFATASSLPGEKPIASARLWPPSRFPPPRDRTRTTTITAFFSRRAFAGNASNGARWGPCPSRAMTNLSAACTSGPHRPSIPNPAMVLTATAAGSARPRFPVNPRFPQGKTSRMGRLCFLGERSGHRDFELRPAAMFGVDLDGSPVLLDDFIRDEKAEACPLAPL